MLIGYNSIRYFEDKALQRWENADNKYLYVWFKTNKIPPFVLISDTVETSATVQIFDANTDAVVGAAQAVTITTNGSNKQLKFDGFDLTGMDESCYYSKIVLGAITYKNTLDGDTGTPTGGSALADGVGTTGWWYRCTTAGTYNYGSGDITLAVGDNLIYNGTTWEKTTDIYSEVFAWTEDSTANLKENGLLKLTVTSSNITLGGTYEIDLTNITYECFFEVQDPDETPDTKEKGVEKPQGDVPIFNTRVLKLKFQFVGNYDLLEFLSGLVELSTIGTVIFTYKGLARTALDIIFELEETHPDQEAISGSLQYTRNDYLSSRNAI
jgi:hypothetical protein